MPARKPKPAAQKPITEEVVDRFARRLLKAANAAKKAEARRRARAKARRLPFAQILVRGKGARKVPILINRLPKDLIERIKRESPIHTTCYSPLGMEKSPHRIAVISFKHKPNLGAIVREVTSEVISGRDWQISNTAYFDAKTGKKLTNAQVMNRMKRKGIASL